LSENADDLQEKIEFFQTKGYEVWMDDFGSGYSSLNVLKDYNFDVLKIDMLFLRDFESNPKSKEIVASIIEMAKKLGIDTLVEGVETKEQYDYLKEIGCNKVQGYYLGKPSPFDKRLISFIAKNVESKNLKDTNNLILEKSVTKKQDSIITPRILATKYQRAFV
jgi:EAL domain-containing protein (putative c-di-GMP-specific phosphodiesterase class I)